MNRNFNIDCFRGVSIFMILILHAVAMTPDLVNYKYFVILCNRLGDGVPFFFVISGFVIAQSFNRHRHKDNSTMYFFLRRAAKMLPLYYIVLHINIVIFLYSKNLIADPIFFRNSISYQNLSIVNYLIHVVFLQGMFPYKIHSLVDGSWSIVCEVYFYSLYPIFAKYLNLNRNVAILFIYSLIFFIAFLYVLKSNSTEFSKIAESGFLYYNFFAQLPSFIVGLYCYSMKELSAAKEFCDRDRLWLCIALSVLYLGTSDSRALPVGFHVVSSIYLGAMILLMPPLPKKSILVFFEIIGRRSYALFFSHMIALKIFYTFYISSAKNLSFLTTVGLNLIVSILVGGIIAFAIFHPIDDWCVKKVNRWIRYNNKRAD